MTVSGIIRMVARRDQLTENEAANIVLECIEAIEDAVARGCYEEAENILRSELSLEPDYLIDILEGD